MVALLLGAACATTGRAGSGEGQSSPFLTSLQLTRSEGQLSFALDVTNLSDVAEPIRFRNGQSAEFTLERGGEPIWRWSTDQMFTQAVRDEVLEPGATRRYEGQWQIPAGTSGEFIATGRWLAVGREIEQSTRITLP